VVSLVLSPTKTEQLGIVYYWFKETYFLAFLA